MSEERRRQPSPRGVEDTEIHDDQHRRTSEHEACVEEEFQPVAVKETDTRCEICLSLEPAEYLRSMCQCSDTLVHKTCLELKLTALSTDLCKLCGHKYRAEWVPRCSALVWFAQPDNFAQMLFVTQLVTLLLCEAVLIAEVVNLSLQDLQGTSDLEYFLIVNHENWGNVKKLLEQNWRRLEGYWHYVFKKTRILANLGLRRTSKSSEDVGGNENLLEVVGAPSVRNVLEEYWLLLVDVTDLPHWFWALAVAAISGQVALLVFLVVNTTTAFRRWRRENSVVVLL